MERMEVKCENCGRGMKEYFICVDCISAIHPSKLIKWLDEQIAECQAMIDRHSYFGYQSHYSAKEIEAENNPCELRRDVFQEVKNHLISEKEFRKLHKNEWLPPEDDS